MKKLKYVKLFENFNQTSESKNKPIDESGTWLLGDSVYKSMKQGPPDDESKAFTYGTNNGVIAWYNKDGEYYSYKLKDGETYKDAMSKYGIDYKWKDTGIVVLGSNGDFGDEGMANHPSHYTNR
jgi:hypothetical protein